MKFHRQLSSPSGNCAVKHVVLALCCVTQLNYFRGVCFGEVPAEDVVSQLITGRERLYAGDVSIRGVERRETLGAKHAVRTRSIQERLRFDFPQGRLWHEKELSSADTAPGSSPLREIIVYGKDGTYRKSVEAMQIVIGKAGVPGGFWDPRIYGLCTYDDLLRFTSLAKYAEAFREGINEGKFSVEPKGSDGIIVAEYLYGSSSSKPEVIDGRRRIWIDSDRGFVPIRTEQQQRKNGSNMSDAGTWSPPAAVSTATWEKKDDAWIPTSAIIKLKVGDSTGEGLDITYELAFEWHRVNPPLDESQFSMERLDVPAGSHYVIDSRPDRTHPVVVQHPAVPDANALKRIQDANKPVGQILTPKSRGWYYLSLSVLAATFLVAWVWRHRCLTRSR